MCDLSFDPGELGFDLAETDCLRGNAPAPADKRPFTDPQSPAFRTASKKTPGRRNNRRQHAHCSPATGGSQPLNWRPRTSLDPGKWAAGCSCRLTTCPLVSSTLREDDLMSTTVAQPAPRACSATARVAPRQLTNTAPRTPSELRRPRPCAGHRTVQCSAPALFVYTLRSLSCTQKPWRNIGCTPNLAEGIQN